MIIIVDEQDRKLRYQLSEMSPLVSKSSNINYTVFKFCYLKIDLRYVQVVLNDFYFSSDDRIWLSLSCVPWFPATVYRLVCI